MVLVLNACADTTGGMGASQRLIEGVPSAVPEIFAYDKVSNGLVEVVVDKVLVRGDRDFLPTNTNWIQIHLTISNVGSQAVSLASIKERLTDGTVLRATTSRAETEKPPNIGKDVATGVGMIAAGQMLGYMLFPPAALLMGAASSVYGMRQMSRRSESLDNSRDLQLETITPGTKVSGNLYLPAVKGQSGFVVGYLVGQSQGYIDVRRSSPNAVPAQQVSLPRPLPAPAPVNVVVCQVSSCKVRRGPGSKQAVLLSVPMGSSLRLNGPAQSGWWKVVISDGREGFVNSAIVHTGVGQSAAVSSGRP